MRTRSFLPPWAVFLPFFALMSAFALSISAVRAAEPAEESSAWEANVSPEITGEPIEAQPAESTKTLSDLKADLTSDDPLAVLEAVRFALDEVGDGATYVWRREEGPLWGMVRPTGSFRTTDGRICRHIIVTLSLDEYTRQTDGDACRIEDGRWVLANELTLAPASAP